MKKIVSRLLLIVSLVMIVSSPIYGQEEQDKDGFALIDDLINAEIMYGLSGAQLVVMHNGEVVKQSAYGYTNSYESIEEAGSIVLDDIKVIPVEERNKVTNDTLYDLASNTKMYAGNYAIQYLITNSQITLDTKLVDIFPSYSYQGIGYDGQADLTIGHLLRHDSGFIASPKYHDNTFTGNLGNGSNPENYLYTQDESEILNKLLLTPLEYEPGTKVRYSDVDFMLIGKVVEEISGIPFDEFLETYIYGPVGVSNVMFNPLEHGYNANDIASTELHGNTRDGRVFFNNYRDYILTGEVHDEKAFYTFKGIAGHAGLYGNATDIATLAQLMLETNNPLFTQETIDTFMEPSVLNDTYAYGWRRQGESKTYSWAFSEYASVDTIGHTGWTGTLTQIDPDNKLVIVLLTNARNSPIMGPDKNDFYTKAFRTNDYGTITTLVYEALGLGSDVTNTDFVIEKIEDEIALNKDTASNRNELRALYSVLKEYAINDTVARSYVKDNLEEDIISLDDTFEEDTKHLDLSMLEVDKSKLQEAFEKADSTSQLSDEGLEAYKYAQLINKDQTASQTVINDATQKLLAQLDNTEVVEPEVVDTNKLEKLVTEIASLDKSKYNQESWGNLWKVYLEAKAYLSSDDLIQSEVDAYYTDLSNAFKALVLETVTKQPSVLPATGASSLPILGLGVVVSGLGAALIASQKQKKS